MIKILFTIVTLGIFYVPSYETMQKRAKTPEDMEWYLDYFEYKEDKKQEDSWKSPEEFYRDKGGDCEDFAVFIYEILRQHGYRCKIYGLYGDKGAHAIVTYEKGEEAGYFSNDKHKAGHNLIGIICYLDYEYDFYKQYEWKRRRAYSRRNQVKA